MEKTGHVFLVGRKWRFSSLGPVYSNPLTTKASNRAAVHGVRPPVPDVIDKEQVQKKIQKAKEDKEAKRRQIEKTIGSHISNSSESNSSSTR